MQYSVGREGGLPAKQTSKGRRVLAVVRCSWVLSIIYRLEKSVMDCTVLPPVATRGLRTMRPLQGENKGGGSHLVRVVSVCGRAGKVVGKGRGVY